MSAITVENLTYFYDNTIPPALHNINLEIEAGSFTLLLGSSGSGKSTLLRVLAGLAPAYYGGSYHGGIFLDGREISSLTRRGLIARVGLVFQDPETQLIMTGVEQEIAFGIENMGVDNRLMKRRVAEISASLGITAYLQQYIPELSGGIKQKVALASILAMQPQILLLDEPASQLDPVAAEEFLGIIRRLNEDQGLTIIMVEQRLERCFQMADRIIVMEQGRIAQDCSGEELKSGVPFDNSFSTLIPPVPRMFSYAGFEILPFTVKEGRQILRKELIPGSQDTVPGEKTTWPATPGLRPYEVEAKNLYYTYPGGHEALRDININIAQGDFLAVIGENGAGKTTLLKILAGLLKPGRGTVIIEERDAAAINLEDRAPYTAYLSQEPGDYLFMPTVAEEVALTLNNMGLTDEGQVEHLLASMEIDSFKDTNPRDLSAGERQRVALASLLAGRPRLLLLDEPTRGLDYTHKETLGILLSNLREQGVTIVMVSHDVDFAAEYARDIALMSNGTIIAAGNKYEMLQNSSYYSSQTSKLFHGIRDDVVTVDEGKVILKQLLASSQSGESEEGGSVNV